MEGLLFALLIVASLGWWLMDGRLRWRMFREQWHAFQLWQQTQLQMPVDTSFKSSLPQRSVSLLQPETLFNLPIINTGVLSNAGAALESPPKGLEHAARHLHEAGRFDTPYVFPIGWRCIDGEPSLINASFVGEVNHIEVSGMSDSGKDGWIRTILLYLSLTTPPEKLQIALLDGKGGMSWQGWAEKSHTWLIAEEEAQLVDAMQRLVVEREKRQKKLKLAGCEKWEEYSGSDIPLLIVVVSEITLLEKAFGKNELESWLNAEMVSARASGIRYILATQTFSGYSTKFRGQIGLFVAGYQNRADADDPNTGLSRKDLLEYGKRIKQLADGRVIEEQVSVPPSMLPDPPYGAGVFTCVKGKVVVTVRQSLIDKPLREQYLSLLPSKSSVAIQSNQPINNSLDESHSQPEPIKPLIVDELSSVKALIDLQVSGQLSLRELQSNILFQEYCSSMYDETRSYKGIVERLWGTYSGPRADCVKEAISQYRSNESLLKGMLAA